MGDTRFRDKMHDPSCRHLVIRDESTSSVRSFLLFYVIQPTNTFSYFVVFTDLTLTLPLLFLTVEFYHPSLFQRDSSVNLSLYFHFYFNNFLKSLPYVIDG